LGANQQLPALPADTIIPEPPMLVNDDKKVERGSILYAEHCSYCHGVGVIGGGALPDLRYSAAAIHHNFKDIVGKGYFAAMGMPSFKGVLDEAEIEAIHAYVIKQAHKDKKLREEPSWMHKIRLWIYEVITWVLATFIGGSSSSA
jgi:quinohemoprotein ethanol dehydrogenase